MKSLIIQFFTSSFFIPIKAHSMKKILTALNVNWNWHAGTWCCVEKKLNSLFRHTHFLPWENCDVHHFRPQSLIFWTCSKTDKMFLTIDHFQSYTNTRETLRIENNNPFRINSSFQRELLPLILVWLEVKIFFPLSLSKKSKVINFGWSFRILALPAPFSQKKNIKDEKFLILDPNLKR